MCFLHRGGCPPCRLPKCVFHSRNRPKLSADGDRHSLESRNFRPNNATAFHLKSISLRICPHFNLQRTTAFIGPEHVLSTDPSGRRPVNKLTCCTSWSRGREGLPVRWRCSSIEHRWRWRRRRYRPFGWHPPERHVRESRAWWRNGIGEFYDDQPADRAAAGR